jgi:tetratricopeptide (TPR) repeat protein
MRTDAAVLRAEMLERTGQIDAARIEAERLLKSRGLTPAEQSTCHVVLARAEVLKRHFDSAAIHLQRAVQAANGVEDWEKSFWAQYRLLDLVSEQAGPDATVPLIGQLRATAVRAAVPSIFAALHLVVAQAEAKRGLTDPASRHLDIGASILRDCEHAWLRGHLHQLQCGVAMVRADFTDALEHAHRAVELAEISGAGVSIAIARGNLAHLLFLLGRFEEAVGHQQLALAQIPQGSDFFLGALDTYASIRLAQGRVNDAIRILDQSANKLRSAARSAYPHSNIDKGRTAPRSSDARGTRGTAFRTVGRRIGIPHWNTRTR